MARKLVDCPICDNSVTETFINRHIDSGCKEGIIAGTTENLKKALVDDAHVKPQTKQTKIAPIFTPIKRTASQASRHAMTSPMASSSEPSSSQPEQPPPSKRLRSEKAPKTISSTLSSVAPLADRLRPQTLDDFAGHETIIGQGTVLRGLIDSGSSGSLLLWGPPGSGKTSLARIIARTTGSVMKELSATSSGAADIRNVFEEAKNLLTLTGKRTVLFVDEIHRYNKGQQDIFLPYVERGWVTLIAATTENPSFKVNNALLSRCRVLVLDRLTDENIHTILTRAIARVEGTENNIHATEPALQRIVSLSLGDARTALSLLELVLEAPTSATEENIFETMKKTTISRYDRSGDDRYEMISALHKSVRTSDGSAAMYWMARMITAGEDPLYIARRLIVIASEDVGLADPKALPLATSTYFACQNIGMPECRINLAHCIAYLAEAPKSSRAWDAYLKAEEAVKRTSTAPVPINIRNAPTTLLKSLSYGAEYNYNHTYMHPVHNVCLPPEVLEKDEAKGNFLLPEEAHASGEGKIWNEEKLKEWERRENGGRPWEGRAEFDKGGPLAMHLEESSEEVGVGNQ